MKNALKLLFVGLFLVSCSVSKPVAKNTSTKNTGNQRVLKSNARGKGKDKTISKILADAEKYIGTPYKLGGMTASGMDCSGLVVKVFDENNLKMPRRSQDQAKEGKSIRINEVKSGDLLFFATTGGDKVSHIGIVHSVENTGEIKFIHASTSRGVIISSLDNVYWNKAFLFARRVIF